MASTGSLFSQTLHEITNAKLTELAAKKDAFNDRRLNIIARSGLESDLVKRLTAMSSHVKTLFAVSTTNGRVNCGSSGNARLEIDLKNLDRFLAQARYDPSIGEKIIGQWQQTLIRHMDVQSLKYTYASLYGQVTTEWLADKQAPAPGAKSGENEEMGDYEVVGGAKRMEGRRKWEQAVFEPTQVDVNAIKKMFSDLFEATPDDSRHSIKAMKSLRDRVENFERELVMPNSITIDDLRWTIAGLQQSDLLTDEKRQVLKDFSGNEVILREIADVLNMRLAALDTWSWGDEVLLEERRQLSGKFNIYMHEDLLQAVFLQYIGVKWSVFWKWTFSNFRKTKGVWKSPRTAIPSKDLKRREYYLQEDDVLLQSSVQQEKQRIYRKSYFVSQLLSHERQNVTVEEGEEEADLESYTQSVSLTQTQRAAAQQVQQPIQRQMMAQPAGKRKASGRGLGRGGAKRHRKIYVETDDNEFEDDDTEPLQPMEAKQQLLHLLSTDVLIKTRLQGEITCVRSQIDNLYPSLPHATIEKVLAFFGVSQKWLGFFRRFLQAPLRFMDDVESQPRKRRQGTPGSHVLSEVFGDVVLFGLDYLINQNTGGQILWRMNDDLWFWSADNSACHKVWSLITSFTKTMGLSLNPVRSGSVRMAKDANDTSKVTPMDVGSGLPNGQIRWGMLVFNPSSGRFEIDQAIVDHHIDDLSKQLKDKSGSLFSWIQTWNAFAAKFFTSNFGKPANCYGRGHVDNMLATHEHIQRQIFSSSGEDMDNDEGGSVVDYLKQTIAKRFGIKDIPDGYFFFPTELGGLDVQSPFIGLLQVRDELVAQPHTLLDKFFEDEREDYKIRKKDFEARGPRIGHSSAEDPSFVPEDPDTFFSFEEFTKYREELGAQATGELYDVFQNLLKQPVEEGINCEDGGVVQGALGALRQREGLRGILANWHSMEPYWKWVVQLYGPEMVERFGGLSIVEPGLLPMGMVSLFKSGRVQWGE